ncbi:MAG: glycosyltransferase family 39 protein [Methanobacteriaceae archaeon]
MSLLVYLLVSINNQLGIYCSDVFVYLVNSLNLAGIDVGSNSTLYLSPVICFLTSILFRLGFVNQVAIFSVTGFFLVIGGVGTYLFFNLALNSLNCNGYGSNSSITSNKDINVSKNISNKLLAFLGAIVFTSFSLNILWSANGTLDIPAIAISIWIMYFTILATNNDSKYFIIALPLFVIGFFTRYTTGFILLLMLLWICLKIDLISKFEDFTKIISKKLYSNSNSSTANDNDNISPVGSIKNTKNTKNTQNSLKYYIKLIADSKATKNFIIGAIISIVIFIAVLLILKYLGSSFTFFGQTQYVVTGGKGLANDPGFNPNPLFYINYLPNFISSTNIAFKGFIPVLERVSVLAYFVLFVTGLSTVAYIINFIYNIINFNQNNDDNSGNNNNNNITNNNSNKFYLFGKIAVLILISIVTIFTYMKISSIVTEILFLVSILMAFNIFKRYKIANLDFTLLMFAWFIIYLIFFTFSDVKVDRYFITAMPAIAYFFIFSIKFFLDKINKKNQEGLSSKNIIKNSIIPVLLISIFIFASFAHVSTIPTENILVDNPVYVSNWLMEYDPDYASKVIWVYSVRPYTWYLKKEVFGAYEKDLVNLEKNNVYYYISNKNYNLTNYSIIKEHNGIYIHERN